MQIHIGNLIRNELRHQGHTNEWLAEQIGTSPRNLWRVYNKPSLDTQLLLNISLALHTDFFQHYTKVIAIMTDAVIRQHQS